MDKKKVEKSTNHKAGDKKTGNFNGHYYYAVGRRKSSTATVRLYPKGRGIIEVNGVDFKNYFPGEINQIKLSSPLKVASLENKCDLSIRVKGGGITGQAEAIRLAIARALILLQAELRPVLRKQGLLTRDARVKERKKPGLKRARRAPQWQKR